MTKLVINADDFGYSKGVNLGIMEAFYNGVVSSTTLMANMPGAAHAAALALDNPKLGVGIHLVLDCGKPVHPTVPSLVDDKGYFHKTEKMIQHANLKDIEIELHSQMEKFQSFGLIPTHLDSHHHVHGHEKIFPVIERIAQYYNLPIRKVSANPSHSGNVKLRTTEYFCHEFYGDGLTVPFLINLIEKCSSYDTAELMCHPAFIDEPLLTGSSYSLQRVKELAILCDLEIRNVLKNKDIKLVTYKEIIEDYAY
jgi:chitin disaccharide deacetylase